MLSDFKWNKWRPVRTWSGFNPHRSHTSIITSTNWIATGSIHFDPVRTTNLTRDDSYTRPKCHHVIAYLPLLLHSLVSGYAIQLALDTVCSPYIQQLVCFLYSPTSSTNTCPCHVITSFPVIIHVLSRSNPPTRGGLARSRRSRSDQHNSAYAKMPTSTDRPELDPIAIQSRLMC